MWRAHTSVPLLTLVILGLVGACGGNKVPQPGFDVPDGVSVSSWESEVASGAVLDLVMGDAAGGTDGTVVQAAVVDVQIGKTRDLALFEGVPKQTVPWYVSVTMKNLGPATIDLTAEKGWFLRVDEVLQPPVEVAGGFKKCPTADVPKKFEVGGELLNCQLFFVPKDKRPSHVDLLRHDGIDSAAWKVPLADK